MMELTYIYGLVDPRTGLVMYVGKSNNPWERLRNHQSKRGRNARKIRWYRELKAIGLKPEIIILERCIISGWEEREQWWIASYRTINSNLLNLARGGNGLGVTTEEMRERRIITLRGRKLSAEHRYKISVAHRGKRRAAFSLEALKNMSLAHLGLKLGPCSPETRKKIGDANRGRILTPGHRQKISDSLRGIFVGRPIPQGQRDKISATLRGRKLTEKHRMNISRGLKARSCAQITAPTS